MPAGWTWRFSLTFRRDMSMVFRRAFGNLMRPWLLLWASRMKLETPSWRTCSCHLAGGRRRRRRLFSGRLMKAFGHSSITWMESNQIGKSMVIYMCSLFYFNFYFSWPINLTSHSYPIIQLISSYRHPRPRPPDCPHPYPAPAPAPGPELDPECGGGNRKDPGGNCCAPPICTGGKCPPPCSGRNAAGFIPGGVGACPGGKFIPGIPGIGGGGGHGP